MARDDADTLVEVDTVPVLYLGIDRKNTVLELRNVSQNVDP
jgi:hypothetical protein